MRAALFCLALFAAISCGAQDVRVQVKIVHEKNPRETSNANVVVWLTPVGGALKTPPPLEHIRLVQKNKEFTPHLLAITAGTSVEFPNEDPFFHNVFSLYKGKRFDLGLYEAGSSRSVKFDRPGVSFIFCNIHPDMSATVIALPTQYFAVSKTNGEALIRNVPEGKYKMEVWYERSTPEALQKLTSEISVPASREIALEVRELIPDKVPHKNKYGQDYDKSNPYGTQP